MSSPVEVGSELQLFVDEMLIERMQGAELFLHSPKPVGKVMDFSQPWEGSQTNYVHIFQDGQKWRMYYRGASPEMQEGVPGSSRICYAESSDGIHWTKPNLELYEFAGTTKNNITYLGPGTTKWYCFKDDNPATSPEQQYKAICNLTLSFGGPLGVMVSPNGFQWRWLRKEPVITGGPLDTLNVVRWDPKRGEYLAFVRNWVSKDPGYGEPPDVDAPPEEYNSWYTQPDKARAIAVTTSQDFIHWTRQQWIFPPETPVEHLYTSAVTPYFRAPHIWVGFPMRYFPERTVVPGWPRSTMAASTGCSDAVFISSRDGLHWRRQFMEAFLRPGPDQNNWTDRNVMIAPGIIPTGPGEMSLYYVAHYGHKDCHLVRAVLRLDGFTSVKAQYTGGELVTKPLQFTGNRLVINYSTSAAGSIAVELQDEAGNPLAGFALDDCRLIIGDQIARTVEWAEGSDLSSLAGKPVRVRFVLKDADLYSIRFPE